MSIKFTPRTTKPEAGNKYYIRKANGGYSDAVQGSPTDKDCNVLSNCVGYAYGRFNEIGNFGYCKYLAPVNAENFIQCKGSCKTGMTPKVGACMVWQKGATLNGSDGAGHVAIVEKVINDTEVITSESAWGGSAFYTMTRKKGADGNWGYGGKFLGFIYNPADLEEPAPTKVKKYELVVSVPTYNNAASAKSKTNANSITYGPGVFYIYTKYPDGVDGMFNITNDSTGASAGAWINPADNVKPVVKPTRKYKVGDYVEFTYIFEKSTTTTKLLPAITQGKITRVLEEDVANPYLIEEGNIGWTNEACITGIVSEPKVEEVKKEEKPAIQEETKKEETKVEEKPEVKEEILVEPEKQDPIPDVKEEPQTPDIENEQDTELDLDQSDIDNSDEDNVQDEELEIDDSDDDVLDDNKINIVQKILKYIIDVLLKIFKK